MTQNELILIILLFMNIVNAINCFTLYNIHRAILKLKGEDEE